MRRSRDDSDGATAAAAAAGHERAAREIHTAYLRRIHERADRMLAWVLLLEWSAAVLIAPRVASGGELALAIGTALAGGCGAVALPLHLAFKRPGAPSTRQAIAIGQAIVACLLLHAAGGRTEAHVVAFGSIALLARYLDVDLIFIATAIVAADYVAGAQLWPRAVYGAVAVGPAASLWLRFVPWMLVEALLLALAIRQAGRDLVATVRRQIAVETSRAALEREVVERQRTERLLSFQYVVTRLLATSTTLAEAAPALLRIVGESHGWDLGELWEVAEVAEQGLRRVGVWHADGYQPGPRPIEHHGGGALEAEGGLPGRVRSRHLALWVADMADAGFPLDAFKVAADLHGAFAIPLRNGPDVIGVMAFYSRDVCEPDDDHLAMVSALGGQIGQFMDRKRIVARLRAAHAELESAVEKRTWELREANEKLRREMEGREAVQLELRRAKELADSASQAKSAFLANMSHELRTPLNAVIGFSELLEQEIFGPLTDKQRSYVGNVLVSGRHLLQLVNDVLDISKVEAGRMDLVCEWTPVEVIFDVVRSVLEALAQKKGINLEVALPPSLPRLHVDPGRMKQVLYNLVANGIKFTPRGGTVRLSAHPEPEHVTIDVADTGIGIAPEDLPRLFHEFEQIPQPGGPRPEGTGLGLALTRRLVTLHGGEVSVKSRLGVGSVFSVRIPVRAREAVETERARAY